MHFRHLMQNAVKLNTNLILNAVSYYYWLTASINLTEVNEITELQVITALKLRRKNDIIELKNLKEILFLVNLLKLIRIRSK